jgi:hexosaminidase
VKRHIDLMAMYKLNRLHLHLSDDQGWRIEIPGRPRLTAHGASTAVGGRPGGYYSLDDWQELVRYASMRFVTLVPEIDMPGHTNAALASYPELTCDGVAPPLYTGTEVGFSFLCVENSETYAFVDDVVGAISEVTPGEYFHLGGDEARMLTSDQYTEFMLRALDIVGDAGKTVVAWDEVAEVGLQLEQGTIIQVWRPQNEASRRRSPTVVGVAERDF